MVVVSTTEEPDSAVMAGLGMGERTSIKSDNLIQASTLA